MKAPHAYAFTAVVVPLLAALALALPTEFLQCSNAPDEADAYGQAPNIPDTRQGAIPDFTVTELSTDPVMPYEWQNFTIKCVATNLENWSDTTELEILVDGISLGNWSVPLIKGENTTKYIVANLPAGNHTLCAVVDGTSAIVESNETNNVLCINFTINAVPVAVLDVENYEVFSGETVHFSARLSYDKDDGIDAYYFDFGDLTTTGWTCEPNVTHVYQGKGNFRASLRVRDKRGAESAACAVLIKILNRLPNANISISQTTAYTGENITVSSVSSSDPDGEIIEVLWNFGDGSPDSTERIATHSYANKGNYTIVLTVMDNDGGSHPSSIRVCILNRPPTCSFEVERSRGDTTTPFLFISHAKDADGQITYWDWDFGDGSQGSSARVIHRYSEPGTYNVTLRVLDDEQSWSADYAFASVIVTKPPGETATCAQLFFLGMLAITIIAITILVGYFGKRLSGLRKNDERVTTKEARPIEYNDVVHESIKEPFKIEDLFVIYNDGRLIFRHMRPSGSKVSDHALSGMLTAIRAFASSSFPSEEKLESINYGKKKIFLEGAEKFYIAVVLSGEPPADLRASMSKFVGSIRDRFGEKLKAWKGARQDFEGIEEDVNAFLIAVENEKQGLE